MFMKKIQFTLILLIISISCKSQELNVQQLINDYSSEIIGVWIDENDENYKLEFLDNGICKEYVGTELIATYNYSLDDNCEGYIASNTVYLNWVDTEDQKTTCFEINNITNHSLSIMIIDKARVVFFNKE